MKSIIKTPILALTIGGGIVSPLDPSVIEEPTSLTLAGVYGAFTEDEDYTIEFVTHGDANKLILHVEYINPVYDTRILMQSIKVSNFISRKIFFTYTLQFKNKLKSTGLKLHFYFGNENDYIWSKSLTIYPKKKESINAKYYKKNNYLINGTLLGEGKGWILPDIYNFTNTIDFITTNKDNSLDVSEISFHHSPQINKMDKNNDCYLIINDIYNIYQSIDKSDDQLIKLPVKILSSNNECRFSFVNNMFVNPNTLEMSFKEQIGFITTDKFYVPLMSSDKFEDTEIYLQLNNIGPNETTITIPLNFIKGNNLIGNCFDSTYCIEGEVKK